MKTKYFKKIQQNTKKQKKNQNQKTKQKTKNKMKQNIPARSTFDALSKCKLSQTCLCHNNVNAPRCERRQNAEQQEKENRLVCNNANSGVA